MATYLDDIVAHHRARAAADRRPLGDVLRAVGAAPEPRPFADVLRAGANSGAVAVIAEVKRRSPSKGDLAPDLDAAELARSYASGGAACLSVLTDEPHFSGSSADLVAARGAVELPVLRKDFTVCRSDVLDTRAMGADAVLLIAAVLDDGELRSFVSVASDVGLAALVEVHDEAELDRALVAGATLVGVNQRDLRSFAVDPERAARVGAAIPDGVVKVAESGVRTRADVERLVAVGFHAVLVGEALVTDGDPATAIRRLTGSVSCS
ncbi:MAG: trpC [Acidimicrobiaceae bacterium]|nr:trpC [Acidimicrobiaceae bacterium]